MNDLHFDNKLKLYIINEKNITILNNKKLIKIHGAIEDLNYSLSQQLPVVKSRFDLNNELFSRLN